MDALGVMPATHSREYQTSRTILKEDYPAAPVHLPTLNSFSIRGVGEMSTTRYPMMSIASTLGGAERSNMGCPH